ncbi:MAG: hypothetical protein ACR5LC_03780 [Symbiopectobacterium sp.]
MKSLPAQRVWKVDPNRVLALFTLGEKRASVRARAGLNIDPDYTLDWIV